MIASKKMGFLNLIYFIIFAILLINQFVLNLAKDVFSPGDELNSTSTLLSASGKFTLGFFTTANTNLTYLGIWYTDDDVKNRKVWIANRDKPMISNGVLVIDESGTMKVIRRGGNNTNTNTTMFNVSNEVVGSGNNTRARAVLEDSGNFVLYDVANGNRTLWQSFDYPTDTLLPGMKLGYNLTTGQNSTLTSWLNYRDPASGGFKLRLEEINNSPQLLIYWHGDVYWSSGPWENGTFQNLRLEGTISSISFLQKTSLISDATGMYITYQTIASPLSMLVLSYVGYLYDGESSIVLTPDFCYGYESYNGCAITELPACRSKRNSFRGSRGHWSGDTIYHDNWSNISLSDCMKICWNDCNCLGFDMNSNGTGCRTWTGGDMTFIHNDSEELKYVLASKQRPKNKTWIWVLCLVFLITSALASVLCFRRSSPAHYQIG